jgi:hypothetical protein
MKEESKEFIFVHAFLTLEWNLMTRSKNVVQAHILHVHWEDGNRKQEWHVYANPHNPEICLVCALACYIFSNPGAFSAVDEIVNKHKEDGVEVEAHGGDGPDRPAPDCNKGCLFPGQFQYERFMSCLHWIVEKYPAVFFTLGMSPGDLGSHLARRGARSYICAGTMVSLPMVPICLCAMWSMGHIKERYLQYEKAGDQYLGQDICGLEVNDESFAGSPNFFDFKERDERADRVYPLLKEYMVCGDHVPASVHHIFYFCFASLCYYHFDYLVKVLHPKNKLQASHFFNNIPNYASNEATVKYPWSKIAAAPTFNGLPPHITILANFKQLKLEMKATRDTILTGVEVLEHDKRCIGSKSHFNKEEILARMDELHSELLKKVDICGQSTATALWNLQFGDGISDNFLVSGDGDKSFS